MEVRLKFNDEFLDILETNTGISSITTLVDDAMNFYSWMISMKKEGKVLLFSDENYENLSEISYTPLDKIKKS